MTEKLAFCENCRDDVEYTTTEKPMTGTLRGKEYRYIGKEAKCNRCNSEIYVAEVMDFNLKALYDVYRKENGIIPLENILAIPQKYAVGKRPLSLLLGWGEQTFTRYCDGDMPTKQYSETLTKIYENPAYYAEILEAGKSNLKSPVAYKKSRKAVDKLLGNTAAVSVFDVTKSKNAKVHIPTIKARIAKPSSGTHTANEVSEWLLAYNRMKETEIGAEAISNLKLQKLLYYAQGCFLALTDRPLFSDKIVAWQHGPVVETVYQTYKHCGAGSIDFTEDFDDASFTEEEKNILIQVYEVFGQYSAWKLRNMTHEETPWKTTAPSGEISLDGIKAYFKENYIE